MTQSQEASGNISSKLEKEIRTKIDVYLEKANALKYIDSQGTIEAAKAALELCEKIGYTLGKQVANAYISHTYLSLCNYEKALDLLPEALNYFVEEGFYDLQWYVYNLLGIIFCELGDFEKSMDFYDHAQTIATKIDLGEKYDTSASTNRALTSVLNNIAENYKLLKEYKEALIYSERAYNLDTQADYSLTKGVSILSLGEIYYLLEDYEKANSLSYKALRYLKYYNYVLKEDDACILIALTSWKKRDYVKADEYFRSAINFKEKESIPIYRIDALISYYGYLKEQGGSTEALDILINACDLSIKYNFAEKVSETSLLLSILYGNLGDHKASFKYIKLHDQYENIYIESYKKNVIRGLKIKKKMQIIEKENNKIVQKNEDLNLKSRSLQGLVEKISIISELGQKITSTLDEHLIVDILYASIKNFMEVTFFCIGIYDEQNSVINYLDVIADGKKEKVPSSSVANVSSFGGSCIKSGQIMIINDVSKEFPLYINEKTFKDQMTLEINTKINSLMFCPLIVNTKTIGVMSIQSKGKNTFTSYNIEMVKALSSYAAIAINNAIKSMELELEVVKTKEVQNKLEVLNKKLLFISENDSLTGIYNRRKFDTYLNIVWNNSLEDGTSLALLLIDIDYFKEYNDNLGHLDGDQCLASVAGTLANLNKRQYFVARYGGDEFVIVVRKCSLDQVVEIGENIRSKIFELNISHNFSKISDRVTVSIGVTSVMPNKETEMNELIRKADNALYIAKEYGRNHVSTGIHSNGYAVPQRRNTDVKNAEKK